MYVNVNATIFQIKKRPLELMLQKFGDCQQ